MRIGELAQATATRAETIRFYEKIGMLPAPARTEGNYRNYDKSHLARLFFIRRARNLGFTIEQIRTLLGLADDKDMTCDAVDAIARDHLAEVERKIADLDVLRRELEQMIAQCRQGSVAECGIMEAFALQSDRY
ncbi:MerR family transcriptional regulator [Sphingopyxis sp. R3-92]|uniref:MerR family transcriptional regulator n=1 Tax=Sphingopyxis sp. R3-92 TaxID=3158553 RepID=UPI003EE74B09